MRLVLRGTRCMKISLLPRKKNKLFLLYQKESAHVIRKIFPVYSEEGNSSINTLCVCIYI